MEYEIVRLPEKNGGWFSGTHQQFFPGYGAGDWRGVETFL